VETLKVKVKEEMQTLLLLLLIVMETDVKRTVVMLKHVTVKVVQKIVVLLETKLLLMSVVMTALMDAQKLATMLKVMTPKVTMLRLNLEIIEKSPLLEQRAFFVTFFLTTKK
jgi:hypothetical protein